LSKIGGLDWGKFVWRRTRPRGWTSFSGSPDNPRNGIARKRQGIDIQGMSDFDSHSLQAGALHLVGPGLPNIELA
jgi:hypothetical protein